MDTTQSVLPLNSLRLWEENYRVGDVDAIVRSVVRFGFNSAVRVWNGTVVAGNHSVKALLQIKAAGLNPPPGIRADGTDWLIPVIDVSSLSWLEAKAFAVADNRTSDLAQNDPERLADLLIELDGGGLLSDVSFDVADIDILKQEAASSRSIPNHTMADPGPVDPESIEDLRVRLGDIWQLGGHRIMCGDSTDTAQIAELMDGAKASLFATDPPYVVKYTGKDRPGQAKDWSAVYREIDIPDGEIFFRSVFSAVAPHVKANAAWYCWHAEKWAPKIVEIWLELGIHWHQTIIWAKPLAAMNFSCYSYRHEPCLMGWKKGSKPAMQLLDPQPDTVWNLDWEGKARSHNPDHPTPKPLDVFGIPMRKHLKPGAICLEPFSGSGSQIMAGEANGMDVRAMEIEPLFCEAGIRRWEAATGKEAVKIGSG